MYKPGHNEAIQIRRKDENYIILGAHVIITANPFNTFGNNFVFGQHFPNICDGLYVTFKSQYSAALISHSIFTFV